MPWLINAAQLDKFRKNQKALIILDASYHMPDDPRDPKKEFIEKHIVNAHFLDLSAFQDPQSNLPNLLLLDEKRLSEKIGALGIRNDYKLIFYDNSGLHTACRALWMFKMVGHNPQQLYILDGGLAAWERYGGKTESGDVTYSPKHYSVKLQPMYLRTLANIKANLQNPEEQMVDVRHPVRFAGGPEPRPGLRTGHIPGSFCFPYTVFFDKEGLFLPLDKIRRRLMDVGIDITSPIISSCGSGTTAPILNFVLDLLNQPNHAVYNGSWSEWGSETLYPGEQSIEERPVETCVG